VVVARDESSSARHPKVGAHTLERQKLQRGEIKTLISLAQKAALVLTDSRKMGVDGDYITMRTWESDVR
jgi:hypothetical protein